MAKYYYKSKSRNYRKITRFFGIPVFIIGMGILIYVFFPLLSWQIYFAPVFASQNFEIPIPKATVASTSTIENLLASATNSLGVDYTNANNWYPTAKAEKNTIIPSYTISIPKIKINGAVVSTADSDLTKHLVQYNVDSIPPLHGNTIIFGHSTLPQLFDENNYKTILANAYELEVGDEIFANIGDIKYKYTIQNISVVEPTDTSVLAQDLRDSYITIITCTPPGTIWKRLIIKAKLNILNG
jgi:sortase A